jgi:Flp pilus assembly protein TadD
MVTNVNEDEITSAYALLSAGNKIDSLKVFQTLHDRAPENLNVMNGMGLALQMNGRHSDALKMFESLLREGGDSSVVLHNISVSCIEIYDYVAAEKAEERAVQLAPKNYEIQFTLATIKIYLGKFDEGKVLLSQFMEVCPNDGRGYMMMAEMVRKQSTDKNVFESMKTAADYAEKSYQLDPKKWQGRKLLTVCYMNLGKLDKAVLTAIGLWPVQAKSH